MKFIFDWSESFYEEKNYWRGDVKILSLEIFQRECCFASAKVSIFLTDAVFSFSSKKYAKIGVQLEDGNPKIDLLFSGRVISFPIAFGKSCAQLELISEPDDYQKQLQNFVRKNINRYRKIDKHKPLKEAINFDELFFGERDLDNPTAFLESDAKCFYWDMRKGKFILSDVNHGERNIEIRSDRILEKSMNVSLAREPYKSVSINLSAKWTQYSYGLIDLYPFIAKKFSDGIICSLTHIKDSVKKLCGLCKNGYNALRCSVKEVNPAAIIPLKNFSRTSREFAIAAKDNSSKKIEVRFKKFYFYGEMLFSWHHRQKRSETISLTVVNTNVERGRDKKINLKLNNVQLPRQYPNWNFFTRYKSGDKILFEAFVFECKENHFSGNKFDESKWNKISRAPDALVSDSCGAFFETERGKNAIKYALQSAVALINYSSRYVEISFCVDAAKFLWITVNEQITLIDKRFEGGQISGKVTKTNLSADAHERIMRITIACSLKKHINNSLDKINEYMRSLQIPIEEKSKIALDEIVKDVEITNPPEEQEKILAQADAKSISDLESELKRHPTKIKVSLAPLSSGCIISRFLKLPDIFLK